MVVYNKTIFQKYRELAITNIDDLVLGETYYSNISPKGPFVLKELQTNKAHYENNCLEWKYSGGDVINWAVVEDTEGKKHTFSLNDRNIGLSYNPWLIFDNEETRDACYLDLAINFKEDEKQYDDEYFDEYFYEY